MSNLLLHTEDFGGAEWSPTDLTLTPGLYPAPTFAGPSAALGSNLQDASAVSVSNILQAVTIIDDSSDWIFSFYIRKDADVTAFPAMNLSLLGGGTPVSGYIMIDPVNGLLNDVSGQPAADARGIDSIDSNWWRAWIRKANNGTGNTTGRVILYPALSDTFGGGFHSASLRSTGGWGANLTNGSALQTYDPAPFYAFTTALPFSTQIGAKRLS